MIEKMKKLSLIVHRDYRVELINGLQDLGVLHIEQKTPVANDRVAYLRDHIAFLNKYLNLLKQYQDEYKVNLPQDDWRDSIAELAKKIDQLKSEMDEFSARGDALKKEAALLAHYGEFDPQVVEGLEKNKIRVAFCSCAKSKFDKLDTSTLSVHVLSESRGGVSYVVFVRKGERLSEKEQEVLANQEEVPMKSLAAVRQEILACAKGKDARRKAIIDHTKYIDSIKNHILLDQDMLANELAQSGMNAEAEGAVYVLTGFVPAAQLALVEDYLRDTDSVYLVDEPDHHDAVPVKLKQNPFARLFEPIMRLYSIPNYWEVDSTAYFAPFYALFFGMCVADAGYGLLMLAITLVAFLVVKGVAARRLVILGIILSLSVIVSGLLFDDFFGIRPVTEYEHEMALLEAEGAHGTAEAAPESASALGAEELEAPAHGEALAAAEGSGHAAAAAGHKPPADPGILKDLAIFRKQSDAMLFPLMLGVIQIIFGWLVRIRNSTRHHGWQGFGEPTGNILVMLGVVFYGLPLLMRAIFRMDAADFVIGPMPVGKWMTAVPSDIGLGILLSGVALILMFNHLDGKIFLRPFAGLYSLFELAQGLIADILSYIRLFALGLAGGLLAEAFNNLALGLVKGPDAAPFMYLFMALILLVGHMLNMGIGLMSAFVHSLRLQFVEFYKAIEFKGNGVEYEPLRVQRAMKTTTDVEKHAQI